jgi:hypothetical protein
MRDPIHRELSKSNPPKKRTARDSASEKLTKTVAGTAGDNPQPAKYELFETDSTRGEVP